MRPELFTIPGTNLSVPSFGAMVMIGFLGAVWWMTRRAARVKANPDLVLNFGFIALIFSVLGARTFYVIHYWEAQFKHHPAQIFNLTAGGFEFYGGLVGAFIPCLLYGWYKRLSIRLWTDMVAPSLLFGMGVGRIGCYLFGCCWGTSCPAELPWAHRFPYGSPPQMHQWQERQMALPGELILVDMTGEATPLPRLFLQVGFAGLDDKARKAAEAVQSARAGGDAGKIEKAEFKQRQLERGLGLIREYRAAFPLPEQELRAMAARPDLQSSHVHPAQLYSAVGPLLLAFLTNAYFYRRKRHGTVFAIGFMLYAVERFLEESVRSDNPVDTFGLTVSQAVSVDVFTLMLVWYLILQRLPLRSPRAVPYVSPERKKTAEPAPA